MVDGLINFSSVLSAEKHFLDGVNVVSVTVVQTHFIPVWKMKLDNSFPGPFEIIVPHVVSVKAQSEVHSIPEFIVRHDH